MKWPGPRLRPFGSTIRLAVALAALQRGLRGGQARHGDAEGRAGDVVQPKLVAELHGAGLAAVLAADAHLETRPRLAPADHGLAHQRAHALAVYHLEGVVGQDLALDVAQQELALGVVARVAEGHLREVVGAEG